MTISEGTLNKISEEKFKFYHCQHCQRMFGSTKEAHEVKFCTTRCRIANWRYRNKINDSNLEKEETQMNTNEIGIKDYIDLKDKNSDLQAELKTNKIKDELSLVQADNMKLKEEITQVKSNLENKLELYSNLERLNQRLKSSLEETRETLRLFPDRTLAFFSKVDKILTNFYNKKVLTIKPDQLKEAGFMIEFIAEDKDGNFSFETSNFYLKRNKGEEVFTLSTINN